jgi:hypothetical protein
MQGSHTLHARPDGTLTITYDYTPAGKGILLEAGLTLHMPPDATEYRWLGLGPQPSTPGKETAAEYGRHHLTRGDLNFNGNRRGTDLAALTRPDGTGILIAPGEETTADIAIEAPLTPGGDIALSHNAAISGRGNKGVPPEHELRVETLGRIQGTLTLIPLAKTWPSPLPGWLGPANARVAPYAPYLRSYDQ